MLSHANFSFPSKADGACRSRVSYDAVVSDAVLAPIVLIMVGPGRFVHPTFMGLDS
jgi:hypothetical protein